MPIAEHQAKLQSDPMDEQDDVSLGDAVRRARKARGLSLQVVAEGVGISTGLLSQIERGISSPSVRNLRAICEVIGIPFLSLFAAQEAPPREAGVIVRAGRRRVLDLGAKGMTKSFLTSRGDGALQMLEVTLDPGGGSGDDAYSHVGEECGVVLAGQLELWIEEDRFVLNPGDAFCFESRRAHRFRNLASEETRVLWITTPPAW